MTTRQIFNLRWNNHTNNMLQVFLEQLASERLVDVTLSCEGKFLKVHKIVLSACSPYFQELFYDYKDQHTVIILNGVKYEDLKSVVNFMYCGEIEIAESQMEGVLAVAEALQVKGLSDVRDRYENRQQMHTQDERGEKGGNVEERKKEESCKPTPFKKRKMEEEKSSSEAGAPIVIGKTKENKYSRETTSRTNEEESKDDWSPEALIKEETLDLDVEEDVAEEEGIEETDVVWRKSSNNYDLPQSSLMTVDDRHSHDDIPEDSNAEDKSCIVEDEFPKAASFGNRHYMKNQEGHTNTSFPLGNTARKTLTCNKRIAADKIPRPPNAFMVFANEWRRKLALLHHGENNKDISIRLGAMWKKLPPDAKETYFAAARRADEEHKLRYPGYTYNPKEARLRKILRKVSLKHGNTSRNHMVPQSLGVEKKKIASSPQQSSEHLPEEAEKK